MSWDETIERCIADDIASDADELAPLNNVVPIRPPLPDTDEAIENVRRCRMDLAEAKKWLDTNERIYAESADELAGCKNALQAAVYELLQSLEVEK